MSWIRAPLLRRRPAPGHQYVRVGDLGRASALLFSRRSFYFREQAPDRPARRRVLAGHPGLIAGDAAPAILDPGIHPLVPVLRSNYWLTIHVLTITLGYAAFALALGCRRHAFPLHPGREPAAASRSSALNQLTYRAMQFGVVLIAAGTILGGVWADYSWGRFWGWDPKEVWALIALLCYLVILHGRYAGWVGQFGFAAWSVVRFPLGAHGLVRRELHSGRGPALLWVFNRRIHGGRDLRRSSALLCRVCRDSQR